jgi:two-component system sensor histidine kinase UhpB
MHQNFAKANYSYFHIWLFTGMQLLFLTHYKAVANELLSAAALQEKARSISESRKDSSIYYFLKAAEQFARESDFSGQASTFNEIGNAYLQMNDHSKAIEYYIAASETYRLKTDNKQMYGRTLINIALIKLGLGESNSALEYAQSGLSIAKEFDDQLAMVFTQRLIGRIYRSKGLYDEAIAQLRQTLTYYRQQEDWANLGESYQNIANNLYDKKDYTAALYFADSSMLFNRLAGSKYNLAHTMLSLASIFYRLNRLDEAKSWGDSTITYGIALSNPFLVMDGYNANANIMLVKNDLEGYSRYMTLYLAQRDSIDRLQQSSLALELEAKYKNQLKQAEIDVLLLEQQLLASNIRRHKNMRNGISFTLVVVVILSLLLVNRYKLLNETRRQLDLEKLRNSIARDLHDDLGSTLSSIHIISKMGQKNDQADASKSLAKIGKYSAILMDKLTDIVWSINPENDNIAQLIARMREFASEILEPKSIELEFHVEEQIYNLKPSLEKRKTIFMVFKEAINNAAKYSQTNKVEIFTGINASLFELKVSDKGKGFDVEMAKKGNGLRNMHERAKLAGGVLNIKSSIGKGTDLILQLPIT